MIEKISKTEKILEDAETVVIDNRYEVDDYMVEVRKEFIIKSKLSIESASKVILNA